MLNKIVTLFLILLCISCNSSSKINNEKKRSKLKVKIGAIIPLTWACCQYGEGVFRRS